MKSVKVNNVGSSLFELIQKMSSREKAYFKRQQAANKTGSKKLKLYDLLNRLPAFNQEQLKHFAQNERLNLNHTYAVLFEDLTKSLVRFQASASPTFVLNQLLAEIEVLFKKGMLKECEVRIKKGMAIAAKQEESAYAMLFQNWQLAYFFSSETVSPIPTIETQIDRVAKQTAELRMTLSFRLLSHMMDTVLKDESLNTQEATQLIAEKIVSNEILQEQPNQTSSRHAYFDLLASSYFYLEDWDACLNYTQQLYEVLKGRSREKQGRSNAYQQTLLLTNLMAISNYSANKENYLLYLEEFQQITRRLDDHKDAELIRRICKPRADIQQVKFARLTGNYESGHQLIQTEFKNFLETETDPHSHVIVNLEIANYYLHFKDYENCLSYCNSLSAIKESREDKEIVYAHGWISVFCCLRLGDHSLFTSKWRSFAQYLKAGNGKDYPMEKRLLDVLKNNFGKSLVVSRKQFADLQQALKANASPVTFPSRHFDLLDWLDYESGKKRSPRRI